MNSWEFEAAERAFGDVVDAAIRTGPQRIESHGLPVAVVLSYDEYRRLMGHQSKLAPWFRPDGQANTVARMLSD
jgi:prevent-host-death family protein